MEIEQRLVQLDFVELLKSVPVRDLHHPGDQLDDGAAGFLQVVIEVDEHHARLKKIHERVRRFADCKIPCLRRASAVAHSAATRRRASGESVSSETPTSVAVCSSAGLSTGHVPGGVRKPAIGETV